MLIKTARILIYPVLFCAIWAAMSVGRFDLPSFPLATSALGSNGTANLEKNHSVQVQSSKLRIAVQTISIGLKNHLARENHESYCSKWNYDYFLVEKKYNESLGYHWQKIPASIDAFDRNKYDYIFWIDADAFFVDCEKSLDHLIRRMKQDNSTWLFSGDTLIINSGQMMWKNTEQSKSILKEVLGLWYPNFDKEQKIFDNGAFASYLAGSRRADRNELHETYKIADQCFHGNRRMCDWIHSGDSSALKAISIDKKLLDGISYVPQSFINSYRSGRSKFENTSFIFHCAGILDKEECIQVFLQELNLANDTLVCKSAMNDV